MIRWLLSSQAARLDIPKSGVEYRSCFDFKYYKAIRTLAVLGGKLTINASVSARRSCQAERHGEGRRSSLNRSAPAERDRQKLSDEGKASKMSGLAPATSIHMNSSGTTGASDCEALCTIAGSDVRISLDLHTVKSFKQPLETPLARRHSIATVPVPSVWLFPCQILIW